MDGEKPSKERIEQMVRSGVANLGFEGLICTEENKDRMRRIASGETTAKEEAKKLVAKYQQKKEE